MPSDAEERRRARQRYRNRVRRALDQADEAFRGEYSKELNELLGLSREEIDAISPGVTDLETYERLMVVVREASRVNLAQAELVNRIRELGSVAVSIARMVPSLRNVV